MNLFSSLTSAESIDFVHPINLASLRREEPSLVYGDNMGNSLHLSVSSILNAERFLGCTVGVQYVGSGGEEDTETIVLQEGGDILIPGRKGRFERGEMPVEYYYMLLGKLEYYNAWVRVGQHDIPREKMHQAIGMSYEGIKVGPRLKEVIDHTSRSFVRAIER